MFESTLFKSLGVSAITGGLTESLKIILIYYDISISNVLLISIIFSYAIAYIAQRRVFNGGRFFGISLLKYCAVALVSIQIANKLLSVLQNNNTIKNFINDKNISETRRKIYNYILLNTSILIIFFGIDYPLRKSFIFLKNKSYDYMYSYFLYGLAVFIYLINNNLININIFDSLNNEKSISANIISSISSISSTASNSIVINTEKLK
jgi:hypothetical protein